MQIRELQAWLLEPNRIQLADTELETRIRRLREGELLPTGGRGKASPTIDERAAGLMLLAVAGPDVGRETVKSVKALSGLVQYEGAVGAVVMPAKAFLGQHRLLDLFTYLLRHPNEASKIDMITIFPRRPSASVIYCPEVGKRAEYKFGPANFETGKMKKGANFSIEFEPCWQLRGNLLYQLADYFKNGPVMGEIISE